MSKRHTSHSTSRMLSDIQTMDKTELETLYGIEIAEDGSVYDLAEFKEFESLQAWADYMDELENDDNYSSFTKIGSKLPFDDEY